MDFFGDKISFAFTTSGLKRINFDNYENDFTFYVGNQIFKCNKFIADFISPKVAEIRNCDSTVNEFRIPTSKGVDPQLFKLIFSLAKGYSIFIAQCDLKPLSSLFKALGNNEFLDFYLATKSPANDRNVVELILIKNEYKLPINTEISYLASHFYKIEKSQLDKLSIDDLYLTFTKKTLCVESEDWLFDFIVDRVHKDPSAKELFEFIEFTNLSPDRISQFTYEISLDDINFGIWKSLCKRLQNEKTGKKRKYQKTDESIRNFSYSTSNEMKGIISYLSTKFHCNIGLLKIINVTASSVYGPEKWYSPNNVVELLTNSSYQSKDEENQWICFDFKERKIIPEYYSIKSCNGGPDNCHPKSWNVEASENGISWTELDRQRDCTIFNDDYDLINNVASFPITRNVKARYIRIKQLGKNTGGNNFLYLQGIEFYGKLIDCEKKSDAYEKVDSKFLSDDFRYV
ncbi:hypothetical protein M9Y10_025703 [Tritrichomonas musculus]|uniref:F5/8 type C domain-containing protein n=1 Tax=Tritrichomonas musculus TaxID=1915356 RepID=A0ABR2HBC2_9EUKA